MAVDPVLICAEPSTAEGLADGLRARGYAAETESDPGAVRDHARRIQPAVVLTRSDLPGIKDLVRDLRAVSPSPKVAVVVRGQDVAGCIDLLEAGVDGLLLDNGDVGSLVVNLHELIDGGFIMDPALVGALAEPPEAAEEIPDPLEEAQADAPSVHFDRFDVPEIVRQGVADASQSSPSVLVEVSAPPTLPALGEPDAIRGAVRILVDNACRRTEEGSLVTVRTSRVDEGITVNVIDRGSWAGRDEVGLELARTLVALHGGILWSEPLPVGGARVSFTIPTQPPTPGGEERAAAVEAMERLAEFGASPEPVLQVKDQQAEEAKSFLGVLVDTLDAPEAILDVTDVEELPPAPVEAPLIVLPPASPLLLDTLELEAEPVAEVEAEAPAEAAVDLPPVPAAPQAIADPETTEPELPATTAVSDRRPKPPPPVRQPRPARPPHFVPDPLHPATQMLRSLALDFDQELGP